jgi:hypothetical protein
MELDVKVKSMMPDRTQYKRYGIMYEPENVWVKIDIDDKEVLNSDVDGTTLTTAGLKLLVGKLANLCDEIDAEHIKTYNK